MPRRVEPSGAVIERIRDRACYGSARNLNIFHRWLAGEMQVSLAREYGVTPTRIGQIIFQQEQHHRHYIERMRSSSRNVRLKGLLASNLEGVMWVLNGWRQDVR